MKKTVLVTGATGYLGKVVTRDLIRSRKYNIHLLLEDLNDYESVNEHILSVGNIDIVLHMAAIVPSRKSADEDIIQTNCFATQNLASLCKEAHFIFLSTECVFGSKPHGSWAPNDVKEPETTYGISKSNAEDFLLNKGDMNKVCILRTSTLYGYDNPERKNFLRFLYESMESETQVEVYTDVCNRPTHVNDVSAFILNVIEKEITGIVHAVSEDYVSRYELSQLFCDAHGYSRDLLIPASQPSSRKMPGQLNIEPSEMFTEQIRFPLKEGILTCLEN